MPYNFSKLLLAITNKYGSVVEFAKALKCDPRTISDKISNVRTFDSAEIEKIMTLLELPREDIMTYFFNNEL